MGHLLYDMFSIINVSFMQLNFILVTIHKSMVYKMKALPMIVMYYCLETHVHISRPYKILPYAFFFIFLLQNLKLILFFLLGLVSYSNYAILFNYLKYLRLPSYGSNIL